METIRSNDGTLIAYKKSGQGAPLVLVHGTSADHTRWKAVLPAQHRLSWISRPQRFALRIEPGGSAVLARQLGLHGSQPAGGLPAKRLAPPLHRTQVQPDPHLQLRPSRPTFFPTGHHALNDPHHVPVKAHHEIWKRRCRTKLPFVWHSGQLSGLTIRPVSNATR
jgi:hypothetical protein